MELHSCMLSLFAVVIQTSVILMAVGYHACLLATIILFDNVRHISFVNGVHNFTFPNTQNVSQGYSVFVDRVPVITATSPERRQQKRRHVKTATLQNGDNSGQNGDNSSQNGDNH